MLRLKVPPTGFRSWMLLSYTGAVARSLPFFFIHLDTFGFNFYPFGTRNNRFNYNTTNAIIYLFTALIWWQFLWRPVIEYFLGAISYLFFKIEKKFKIHALLLCPLFVFIFLNFDTNFADWFLWITGGLLDNACCVKLVRFFFQNLDF